MGEMLCEYDTETGAAYYELSTDAVARTVHLADLVMVDVNAAGQPVGFEVLVPPDQARDALALVAERFPDLKGVLVTLGL